MPNQPFFWGTPGINVQPPTKKCAGSPVPTNFSTLEFDPEGVYNLRQMLGALPSFPGAYTRNQDRFDSADIAWFSSGCSTDENYANQIESNLTRMKKGKPKYDANILCGFEEKTVKLVFDAVCTGDVRCRSLYLIVLL